MFDSAAGLMGHIEQNKCKVIGRDDFYKHRAEMQVEKDALEEALAPAEYKGSAVISSTSRPTTDSTDSDLGGGTSLADDERVYQPPHWQEPAPRRGDPFEDKHTSPTRQLAELAIDRYPPLTASRQETSTVPSNSHSRQALARPWVAAGSVATNTSGSSAGTNTYRDRIQASQSSRHRWEYALTREPNSDTSSDLLGSVASRGKSVDEDDHPVFKDAWGGDKLPRVPLRKTSENLLDTASSVNLMNSSVVSNDSAATRGTRPSRLPSQSEVLPPAARAENQDPNVPYAQIQTIHRVPDRLPRNLDMYWNSVLSCYICPGLNCGKRLASPKEFQTHLLSGVHAVTSVQCPSCLKRFKTTTALVAHAESGSTRCELRKTEDFDREVRAMTAGIIKVDGTWSGAGNAKFESVPVEDWSKKDPDFW